MGSPHAAFAILKDGIKDDLLTYVKTGEEEDDLEAGRYINPETATMLQTTIPFLSAENVQTFEENWGIHSRGTYFTRGAFSPYQFNTIVGRKLDELNAQSAVFNGQWTKADTIDAVEDIICDEMALELAFEGSRFGDLTRIARHKNQAGLYGSDFGTRWLARKLAYKAAGLETRLQDERNWYLPIK
jgi:hypothetical protein